MKGMERIEESLCEKSMKVVSNVIKISAFSIAKRSLGSTVTNPVAPTRPSSSSSSSSSSSIEAVPIKPLMRAQQPQTKTKQTYLVEPQGAITSESSSSSSSCSLVVKEDMNVDGRASDYIRKVREKNQNGGVLTSLESPSRKVLRTRVVK